MKHGETARVLSKIVLALHNWTKEKKTSRAKVYSFDVRDGGLGGHFDIKGERGTRVFGGIDSSGMRGVGIPQSTGSPRPPSTDDSKALFFNHNLSLCFKSSNEEYDFRSGLCRCHWRARKLFNEFGVMYRCLNWVSSSNSGRFWSLTQSLEQLIAHARFEPSHTIGCVWGANTRCLLVDHFPIHAPLLVDWCW